MMAQPQVLSLTVAHFAAVASITAEPDEVVGRGGYRDIGQREQGGRGSVVGAGEPAQGQVLVLAGQPDREVVDLVVGLGDDDAGLTGGGQFRCGADHQRGLPGAGRGVHDDAAVTWPAHVVEDGCDDLAGLGGRVVLAGRCHGCGSSAGSAGGRTGGPPCVHGVWSSDGYSRWAKYPGSRV